MTDTTQTALFDASAAYGPPAPPDPEVGGQPGYQFVKLIGWIPQDWTSTTIQRCCDILDNKRVPLNSAERGEMGGDVPYYGANGRVGYVDGFIFDEPLILLAEDGGFFDEFATREVAYRIDGKSWINNHAHVLRTKVGYDQDFVFYTLVHKNVVPWLSGGTRAKLTKGELQKLPIQAPPLPEQREIARVLGAWDRALTDLDALVEAKRQRADGLAQHLLTGRARLAAFRGAEALQTPIGPVPRDWSETSLGQVFKKRSEKNVGSAVDHVITVGKYAIRPQSEHFDKSVASADRTAYNVIRPGDFVYDPMSAYYGAIGRYDGTEPGIVSPVYRVLTLRRGFDTGFVKHLLAAHYVRHRIAAYSTQGNKEGKRRGLQHDAFEAIPVYAPTEPEQRQIAAVLDAAGAELAALRDQRAALTAQKKGLMQRLLTGEVRVTPNDIDNDLDTGTVGTSTEIG